MTDREHLEEIKSKMIHSVTAVDADDAVDLDQAIGAIRRMIDRRTKK